MVFAGGIFARAETANKDNIDMIYGMNDNDNALQKYLGKMPTFPYKDCNWFL
jgi:hypothetical protein